MNRADIAFVILMVLSLCNLAASILIIHAVMDLEKKVSSNENQTQNH